MSRFATNDARTAPHIDQRREPFFHAVDADGFDFLDRHLQAERSEVLVRDVV